MKVQKIWEVVVMALLLGGLIWLSRQPFETCILFGSFYLLRKQAGGLEVSGCCRKALLTLAIWKIGMLSYRFHYPITVLFPLLLLVNTTIFLFAPATNKEEADSDLETRRVRKNKAVFISGLLSVFTVIMYSKPISSLLLTALLFEMGLVLGVIFDALFREQSNHI